MDTFRKSIIWHSFNTYAYIISMPLFFAGEQITLGALAGLLLLAAILFCYGFFNSLRYIAINQGHIVFINAITKRGMKYPFSDIASAKITRARISDILKLTLKSGKSKYITVDMVTSEQLKTAYKITHERISTT